MYGAVGIRIRSSSFVLSGLDFKLQESEKCFESKKRHLFNPLLHAPCCIIMK
jgi:hypothetical protein